MKPSSSRRRSRCAGTTLDRLEAFADAGGDLIFAGRIPVCCDAELCDRAARLAARCRRIDFSEAALLEALRERRDVEVVRSDDGFPASSLLYQLRDAGNERFLLLVNTERFGETFTRGGCAFAAAGSWSFSIPPPANKSRWPPLMNTAGRYWNTISMRTAICCCV